MNLTIFERLFHAALRSIRKLYLNGVRIQPACRTYLPVQLESYDNS
jgi:hypothetical protein